MSTAHIKGSLYRKIVVFGILISLAVFIITAVLVVVLYVNMTLNTYNERMAKCAGVCQDLYDNTGVYFNEFSGYRVARKRFRENLREIAYSYDLKYMYLYHPGRKEDTRMYYFCVASDPDDDKVVAEERDYGTTINKPLRDIEEKVYNGSIPYGRAYTANNYGAVYTWYFPIKDEHGSIVALLALDVDITSYVSSIALYGSLMLSPVILVMMVILSLLLFYLKRRIFNPIGKLSDKMDNYDPDTPPDLSDIARVGEIGYITDSFESMSDSIRQYVKDIRVLSEEKANSSAELNIARRIQMGIVPDHFEIKDALYEVSAYANPAKEVGGDFYSFFRSGRYLYFMIGDVSGKGIAASMFMSVALSIVREKLRAGMTPAEALNSSNDILCEENPEGMFVTLFAGIFDPYIGELRFANAGHTKPVLISDEVRFLDPDPGIALGLFEDSDIKDDFIFIRKGESIMLYTDGATDAVNPSSEFFGEDRILETVSPEYGAENTRVLVDSIKGFACNTPQFDDTTIITIAHTDAPDKCVTRDLPPVLESFDLFKDDIVGMIGMSAATRKILLACEEAFANMVSYSGADIIGARCTIVDKDLVVRFEDNGIPFDPLNAVLPEKDFDDLDTGGMGIIILRKTAKDILYFRIGGKNLLTITFGT